ncbi:META domain-containing protein [Devosia rhodophyticola]|uniref:META domain-containing protein n=1 Tax=Devosia rhodophyticola TaxID=3026423 RepID=A0ABY7YUV5_9HYPH|nr:META domain-containing protein [Devosia rhodophyticola]WDR05029.1 META domain-containing protein [Devosia rhodophyticola]
MAGRTLVAPILVLVLLLAGWLPTYAAEPAQNMVGQITYRERIALPPGASLRMAIVDMAKPDLPEIVAATAAISPTGQVPLQFDFSVHSRLINAGGQFGLIAQIIADNQIWFASPRPVPLQFGTNPSLALTLSMAEAGTPTFFPIADSPSVSLAVSGQLFETKWQIMAIAGNPVTTQTGLTFSIAADYRSGGNAGCNQYFAQLVLTGDKMSVGPIAATRMACAPAVMVQEAALFAALSNVDSYKLTGPELVLFGADGSDLLHLRAGHN